MLCVLGHVRTGNLYVCYQSMLIEQEKLIMTTVMGFTPAEHFIMEHP